jgi:hypothetical protein
MDGLHPLAAQPPHLAHGQMRCSLGRIPRGSTHPPSTTSSAWYSEEDDPLSARTGRTCRGLAVGRSVARQLSRPVERICQTTQKPGTHSSLIAPTNTHQISQRGTRLLHCRPRARSHRRVHKLLLLTGTYGVRSARQTESCITPRTLGTFAARHVALFPSIRRPSTVTSGVPRSIAWLSTHCQP